MDLCGPFPASYIYIVTLILFPVSVCSGHTLNDTSTLLTDLLDGYNARVRPAVDQTLPVNVNVSMELVAIQEFDEVEERISIVVILYMVWRDEQISWNPDKYNGTQQVTIPSNLVWTPDVILTSAVGTMKPVGSDQGWLTVRYDTDGSALWTPGDGFVSSCALNVRLFPFDKQVCSFAFIAWGQLASEVMLNHMEDTLLTSFYQGNSQWEIAASHVESGATAGGFFSHFTVRIDLQRRSKFFVTNFVIPVMVINLLNVFVFCIPIECGERISFTITVLLAVAVFMNIVIENLPRNSNNMAILCYFLLINVCVSAVVVLETVFCLSVYYRKTSVPTWLAAITRKLECISGKVSSIPQEEINCVDTVEESAENASMKSKRNGVERWAEKVKRLPSLDLSYVTWYDVSRAVDRVLFWVTLTCFLTIGVIHGGIILHKFSADITTKV